MKVTHRYTLLAFCALSIVAIFMFERMELSTSSYERELSEVSGEEFYDLFMENINPIVEKDGIDGLVNTATIALTEERIDMFVCHTLAHDIGHVAGYAEYFTEIEKNISLKNLNFCGSGFIHGVEGELAAQQYPMNVEDLRRFCALIEPLDTYYDGCYHGAGHTFMENTPNATEALNMCDSINTDGNTNVDNCYRGVFSERVAQEIQDGASHHDILAYCNEQPIERQTICALEVNGFGLTPKSSIEDVSDALASCVENEFAEVIQEACVLSVAWAGTDSLLAHTETLLPPELLFELTSNIQKAYISGTLQTFKKTSEYNEGKSLTAFCGAFVNDELQEYCTSLL